MRYSFDVELSDLSSYEVYDAQLGKLKKLERVEVVGTEKNRLPLPFRKQFAMWTVLNSFQLTGSSKRSVGGFVINCLGTEQSSLKVVEFVWRNDYNW